MTFSDPKSVDNVLAAGSHELDGKKVSLFLGWASPNLAASIYYDDVHVLFDFVGIDCLLLKAKY